MTFSNALGDYCSTGNGNSRTLFLLDGFDEVSDQLDSDHEMAGFLRWLLRQPNAIITSRPGGKHPDSLADLDCELETVGFHTEQVRAYIGQTIGNPDHKIALQEFLDNSHPLLLSLMRIPVQLDAFCYIWTGRTGSINAAAVAAADAVSDSENLSTMTSIYQSIERRLWCKDMPRLHKKHGSGYITAASALELGSSEVRRLVQGEIRFLQALAFVGLFHDVVNFHPQECDDVLDSLEGSPLDGPLSDVLGSLSFLRASDVSAPHVHNTARQIPSQRTYHFVHLTYQEFFAAQYFVLCWTSGTKLGCPEFGNRRPIDFDTADFIKQNKYRSRFNIFWRFVAGILRAQDHNHGHTNTADSNGANGHLARFFHALEQEPRDILGPAHQRLVMHCLSEADPEHSRPLFDKHRELLRQWVVWECNTDKHSSLANEAEFPPYMYETVLQDMPDDVKKNMMESHSGASAARLQYMANEIAKNRSLSDWAVVHLGGYHRLPLSVLHTMVLPLNNVFKIADSVFSYEIQSRRSLIVRTISINLPNAMPYFFHFLTDREITKQLSNPDDVMGFADYFIDWFTRRIQPLIPSMGWRALSAEENERLSCYLQDPIRGVRVAAMLALFFQTPLPKAALDTLLGRLQHPDECVVEDTVDELLQAKPLPKELRPAVAQCLRSPNAGTRTRATALLVSSKGLLSESDSFAIMVNLTGADDESRLAVAQALDSAATTLTANIVDLLHSWLEDGSADVSIAAANALSRQTLPTHVLRTLCTLLRDNPSGDVRVLAARVLGNIKTSAPPEVAHELFMALDDPDASVSEMALRSLLKLDLSDSALVEIVKMIDCEGSGDTRLVRDLVTNGRPLTPPVADALFDKFLECEGDSDLRYEILNALYDQAITLPESTVRGLFEEQQRMLTTVDIDDNMEGRKLHGTKPETSVLSEISDILSRRTKLQTDVYEHLLDQLGNGGDVASRVAARALSHPQLLSQEVISGLTKLAQSGDVYMRLTALRILAGKATLPADVLHLFATSVQECISTGTFIAYLDYDSLHIVSDEDYSHILGCNEDSFGKIINSWLRQDRGDVTLYPDGDMYYIVNLPQGTKRILRADLPMSVEHYLEKKGIPKALDQE